MPELNAAILEKFGVSHPPLALERAIPVRPFGHEGSPDHPYNHYELDYFDCFAPRHGERERRHSHHPGNLLIMLYIRIYMLFRIFNYIIYHKSIN